jgi:type II secretory pathway pseudopilin PulG
MRRLPYLLKKNREEGQAVLILLLAIAVILTVGLSLVSRSITDVKISQQSQESARALWVAQAGLEKAIRSNAQIGSAGSPETLNGVSYYVEKNDLGGSTSEYVYPGKVKANEPITVWLVGHDTDGNIVPTSEYNGTLRFYWGEGSESGSSSTAMEITFIYQDSGGFKIKRYAYDPYASRSPSTSFASPATCAGADKNFGGQNFAFCTPSLSLPIAVASGTNYMVKVRLLFNSVPKPIGVKGSANLSLQGSCFPVTATIEESGVTKKYEECQLYESTPPIFDNLLYSGGGLEQ